MAWGFSQVVATFPLPTLPCLLQTAIVHLLRTEHIPFLHSNAAWQLTLSTGGCMAFGVALGYIPGLNSALSLTSLPATFYAIAAGILLCYGAVVQLFKAAYIFVHGRWL